MDRTSNLRQLALLCALLVGVTFATFWPVLHHEFINYDDKDYVTANHWVQKGLTLEGATWAFSTGHASNWHPLTWLSHMLDVQIFGSRPAGHHLTSLLFHLVNSVLLLLLLWQMTGARWRSALVAMLFALHPLHVESVAWVAERKDVLSTFFGLLALISYVRYASKSQGGGTKSKVWYEAALALFALGLMSKPMLVTWPCVMLLLDFWPLHRISPSTLNAQRSTLRQLVMEKLPFFTLSIASCVVTVIVQDEAVAKTELVTLSDRIGNAAVSYVTYLGQTFWPAGLAVFYPFPIELPAAKIIGAITLLLTISLIAVRQARVWPYFITGWLWYLGTLVPVIGLMQVGAQAHADRYTYLPLIGIFIAIAWGFAGLVETHAGLKKIALAITLIALTALGVTAHQQTLQWRNSQTLFAHAAKVTEGNYIALGGLGIEDAQQGNWESATTNLTRSLEFARLHHAEGVINYYLGVTLQMQGKGLEALPYLEAASVSVELRPEKNYRLGLSLIEAGRMDEANASLMEALEARPQSMEFQLGMAVLFIRQGESNRAEQVYRDVIASHPDSVLAQKSFGEFLSLSGRQQEAEAHYTDAVKLKPDDPALRRTYALFLQKLGKTEQATEQLEESLSHTPPAPQTTFEAAELFADFGHPHKAVLWYEKTIQLDSNSVVAINNLAWLLATSPDETIRNGKRAVELSERACQMTEWKVAVLMGTLAAAYAEEGRFAEAAAMARKAQDRAQQDKQEEVANRNQELLKLYESGKPFRDK